MSITIGISRCLLGEKVRYDGQHKLDRYLRDQLGVYVAYYGVCPEVECGLSIPRESMRLVGDADAPRLITTRTGRDLTARMNTWITAALRDLAQRDLCGFIFKTRSPSSAYRDAKIYNTSGAPYTRGPGLFARAFLKRFPRIPVEDEGRLHDDGIRENFIERVFAYARFQKLVRTGFTRGALTAFHTAHKLLLLSHSTVQLRELGRLVAAAKSMRPAALRDRYLELFLDALSKQATVKKNVNTLQHAMGYFKKLLSADEKAELNEVIRSYHRGLVPLIVPVTLIRHYVRLYDEPYLKGQYYLEPHPLELKLRNHV